MHSDLNRGVSPAAKSGVANEVSTQYQRGSQRGTEQTIHEINTKWHKVIRVLVSVISWIVLKNRTRPSQGVHVPTYSVEPLSNATGAPTEGTPLQLL
jgi:hypothetical protein